MRVVFLGTGGAFPTKERNTSSLALQLQGDVFLFDCGEGTQRQLLHSSISYMKIRRIYITHLHGDHFFGLPGLVQTMGLNQRTEALEILGPSGSGADIKRLLEIGFGCTPFEIKVRELADNGSEDTGDHIITARYVEHSVPTLAIRVDEKDRRGRFDRAKAEQLGVPPGPMFSTLTSGSPVTVNGKTVRPEEVLGPPRKGCSFVYSGDSTPCESLKALAKGADLLVYEATFDDSLRDKAGEFKHSTNVLSAQLAKEAGVKYLLLDHISPRYSADELAPMLAACQAVHSKTFYASDLDDLTLSKDGLRRTGTEGLM